MSAEFQDGWAPTSWLSAPIDRQHPPSASLRDWLTDSGLLTAKLRRASARGFQLQLLEHGRGLLIESEHVRRVVLRCDDHPCVYAESYLPEEALTLVPNLRTLGSDPLGEALQARPEVSRGGFEYALLETFALPAEIDDPGDGPFWARRSSFEIGDASLLVAEVFLPAIEDLPRQRISRS